MIENRTGYPIRSAWRSPGDARSYPRADAIAVAPATFNTGVMFGSYMPHRPKSGGGADRFLWEEAVDLFASHFPHLEARGFVES